MRRFIVLVITALAGLVLLPATPAHAGGPTSVLVVDREGRHAAGATDGQLRLRLAWPERWTSRTPPIGQPRSQDSLMAGSIRLTWMIHDVQPWRVDALTIEGSDVWVSTLLMQGGESLFSGCRVPDPGRLASTGEHRTAPDGLEGPRSAGRRCCQSPASTSGSTAPVTGSAARPEPASTGVPAAALAVSAGLSLALGALVGRSWRPRRRVASPAGVETTPVARATAGASPAAYATGREHLKGFTLR